MAGAARGAEVEGSWRAPGRAGLRTWGVISRFPTRPSLLQAAAAVTVAFTKEALKKVKGPLAETPGRSSVARVGMTGAGWDRVAERAPRREAWVFVIRGLWETCQISPGQRALSTSSDPCGLALGLPSNPSPPPTPHFSQGRMDKVS